MIDFRCQVDMTDICSMYEIKRGGGANPGWMGRGEVSQGEGVI